MIYESWQVIYVQNQEQFVEQTAFYTQTRQMREKSNWIAGATYAFGFAWQAKSGIYLEARTTAGINFGDVPYSKESVQSKLGQLLWTRGLFCWLGILMTLKIIKRLQTLMTAKQRFTGRRTKL